MTAPAQRASTGPATAALVLGILSVALIVVPLLSSVLAIVAVALAENVRAAGKAGYAVPITQARWGMWLGIVNLAVWCGVAVWWQIT